MVTRSQVAGITISASLLVGIAANEGYKSSAYADSGGVYTIGYGETKGVKPTDKTTPDRALIVLEKSVNAYAKGVRDCITAPLSQGEFNALVDAAYNAGTRAVCKSPMVKKFNALDYQGACESFKGWYVHDHEGNFVQGLVNRRNKEYQICIGD